jgi:hypothetical protein
LVPLFQAAQPIFDELLRQTAQGSVFHNDDTSMRILELLLHTFLVPYFFPNWRRADFGNRSGLRCSFGERAEGENRQGGPAAGGTRGLVRELWKKEPSIRRGGQLESLVGLG